MTGFTYNYYNGNDMDWGTLCYDYCGDIQWQDFYNVVDNLERAYYMTQDNNNNIFVTGMSHMGIIWKCDLKVIKYNSSGQCQWIKRRLSDDDDDLEKIIMGNDGYLYLGVQAIRNLQYDFLTIKMNPSDGSIIWQSYYGNNDCEDFLIDIKTDNNGNVFVCGGSESNNNSNEDYLVLKYNSNGTLIAEKYYAGDGNGNDRAVSLDIDNQNNVYVTGSSSEFYDPSDDGGVPTMMTIKYDNNLNIIWTKKEFGGYSQNRESRGYELKVVGDYIFVTGASNQSNLFTDYITIKYNTNSYKYWEQKYDFNQGEDVALALGVDDNYNVYVTGRSANQPDPYNSEIYRDYATIKYSANGNQEWVKRYNGTGNSHDEAVDIVVQDEDVVYISGFSLGMYSNYDYLTIRYSSQWLDCDDDLIILNGVSVRMLTDNKNNKIFAVGDNGLISYTQNFGRTWNIIETGTQENINTIKFINSNTGFAAGDNGLLLITSNGGNNWIKKDLKVNNYLNDIYVSDNFTSISCSKGLILKTTNSGITWNNIITDTSYNINSLYFVDRSTGYAVTDNGKILQTANGGINWIKIYQNNNCSFNKITFSDSLTGFAIGDKGFFCKTTDKGKNWNLQILSDNINLSDIYFINQNTGYITGDSGLILNTVNKALNWKKQKTFTWKNLNTIYFYNDNIGFAAGDDGKLLSSSLGEFNNNPMQVSTKESIFTKPDEPILYQNYPNPFNATTKISFHLNSNSYISIKIYDISGRLIKELYDGFKSKGNNQVDFNGSELASGIYFYKLTIFDEYASTVKTVLTNKMVLIK